MHTEEVLTISHMEDSGIAFGHGRSGGYFIPFALPDEIIIGGLPEHAENSGKVFAEILKLEKSSLERIAPPCRHFGACGGCLLQHWQRSAYENWKRACIIEKLQAVGLNTKVHPLFSCKVHERRTVTFSAAIHPEKLLGYNRYREHNIVNIVECPIIHEEIVALLPFLKVLHVTINALKKIRIKVNLLDNGIDVAFMDVPSLSEAQRQACIKHVLTAPILRLSVNDEIIIEKEKPFLHYGKAIVHLPPGAFLQATKKAESYMVERILQHLKKAKNTLDLFAGAGAFSFPLAERMHVHAIENDNAAYSALLRAATHKPLGLKSVRCEKRDLFQRPLTAKELAAYDGLVFDPPRAGAQEQAKEIAKSNLKYVVAVSCNPETFVRDVKILCDGGYHLEEIFPIDQFLWSPHCEIVAFLSKRHAKVGWKL